jgi:hypothetical protein
MNRRLLVGWLLLFLGLPLPCHAEKQMLIGNRGVPAPSNHRDVVNVQDHGAICNGTTDDTMGIQAALDAVGIRGGTIFFPAIGCTGTYKFGALVMPGNPRHKWIRFESEADWTITHEIDWLNWNTAIVGRAGGSGVWGQRLPSFTIYNGAYLENAFYLHPPSEYFTGLLLENISIHNFVNGIDYQSVFGVTLRNVNFEVISGSSVIADNIIGLEIDHGTYVGNADGSTPAVKLLQTPGMGSIQDVHIHNATFNYSGIFLDAPGSTGGQVALFHVDQILYENAQGTYGAFITLGDNLNMRGARLESIQMADHVGTQYLVNVVGTSTVRGLFLVGNYIDNSTPLTGKVGQVSGTFIVGGD